MNQPSFPVTVAVKRPDGSTEQVRVGTAVRVDESFQLTLGELSIGAEADTRPQRRGAPASAGGSMVFPPYGRSKGTPVVGASRQDLDFYANGCRRTLDDPSKARWHEKELVLLAAIEAEVARQEGGGGPGGDQGFEADPLGGDSAPPLTDDDIPF